MPPSQLCCLICEDQALIALALEATLEDAGVRVAGPFATAADALAWVETATPACAILDYKLKDGSCTALIRALRTRGVPFVIYSGWPRRDGGSDGSCADLDGVPWLEKPTDRNVLLAELARIAPLQIAFA